MRFALRRAVTLAASTGLAVAAAVTATAPAQAAPVLPKPASPVAVAHSCSQAVDRGVAACFALRRTDKGFTTRHQLAITPNATPSGYGPSSLQSAYKLPSSTAGSGQRVYIVDAYDDPNAEADLAAYRSQFGLPACTTANGCFKKINQTGGTSYPSADSGWAGEISLDVDMVSAICPNCGITLVEANSASDADLFQAIKEANTLGAKFVSLSWGGSEFSGETTYDNTYFNATGTVYTVSTGDSAYSGGREYPATSSRVVAVGGTSLRTASNARGWTETVWKTSSSEGTGSGCSAYVAKPSWQSTISSTVCSRRAEADVAAVADPATGVAVYQTYGGSGWAVYGGTSAAAPIVAGVYALAGTPAAGTAPASLPWAHAANLNDVTSGNNGTCSPSLLCTAAAGWDGPTGLGTPNSTAAFGGTGSGGGTSNTVTVTSPGTKTGTVGTATSLQLSASDSGGLAVTWTASGLPTGLTLASGTGLVSGTPTTAGTFTVTATASDSTGASGSATFTWTINPSGGATCSGQKLVNPGFESTGGWTATTGVLNTDGAHARTGVGYAWLDGYGTTHTDTLAQTVTLPAGCAATLTFWLGISSSETTTTTAYDKLTVSANGTTLASWSNLNKSAFASRTVNLSAYAGTSVTLKFTGTEDSTLATSFFVDDTAVTLS
ncbi:MAG: putative Ig domain-containing protein [Jatrophihabitans sp.]|uniref:putative Ig domain-containing protein n=1 Tax=Jatrophihabitans sp. TaxID=1932789 RepID=UPI003F7F0DE0